MACCSRRRTQQQIHRRLPNSGLPPPNPSEHPLLSWPLSIPLQLWPRLLGFWSIPTIVRGRKIRGLGSGKIGVEHSTSSCYVLTNPQTEWLLLCTRDRGVSAYPIGRHCCPGHHICGCPVDGTRFALWLRLYPDGRVYVSW